MERLENGVTGIDSTQHFKTPALHHFSDKGDASWKAQ